MRQLIRTDGSTLDLPRSAISINDICKLIGADALDVVQLRHMGEPAHVMVVDDTGMIDGKPVNAEATRLYHANCWPGTTHPICGDVVVAPDEDFGQGDCAGALT